MGSGNELQRQKKGPWNLGESRTETHTLRDKRVRRHRCSGKKALGKGGELRHLCSTQVDSSALSSRLSSGGLSGVSQQNIH